MRAARNFTDLMPEHFEMGSFEHASGCCGAGVDSVMKDAMDAESTDNLSVVLLAFKHYQHLVG